MVIPGPIIEITYSEILQNISEETIAFKYISGLRKIGKSFKSELRPDKKEGSCYVYLDRTGRLVYKDFADTSLNTQISIPEYIARKYNEVVQDSINRIARDFNIISKGIITEESDVYSYFCNINNNREENSYSPLVIKIKKRDWTKADIEYWNQYFIPVSMLERNNIKSVSHIWFYKQDKLVFASEFSDSHQVYSYDYYFSDNIFRRKIYRPYCKQYKWLSNCDYTIVQNYPNIPKSGDLLFIQSSYKDCMVMELLGYYAIAPNNEGTWLAESYWNKLKQRWNKIIYYGNNDWNKENNPGLVYSQKHSERYSIPYIINPQGEPSDISDYIKKYGLDKGKELVERLIKEL